MFKIRTGLHSFLFGIQRTNPRYEDTHLDKTIALNEDERSFLLQEYQPLREEVNRTIDRLTANEAVCAAFVFSLIGASYFFDDKSDIPNRLIEIYASSLAVLTAFFGKTRSDTFRRHLEMLEYYLRDLERRFSKVFGWSNFYALAVRDTYISRQTGSRNLFWHVLKFTTLLNFIFTAYLFIYEMYL
jgi:hypothetical protein